MALQLSQLCYARSPTEVPHGELQVAVDPKSGIIYVADSKNNAIRTISLKERQVGTLTGSGSGEEGFVDGNFAGQ